MGLKAFLFGKDEPQEGDTVSIQNPDYGNYGDEREVTTGVIFSTPGNSPELGNRYNVHYETTEADVEGITFLERDEFVTEKEASKPWWALW